MLSFYCSSSLVCDPWLVVVGCLQVWASCMSLSPFLFVVFLWKLTSVIKSQSVKSIHRSQSKERNTQIKIVFLSTRKTSQVSGISLVEMWLIFIWWVFFHPQRADDCIHVLDCTWVFILPSLSSSDVKVLGRWALSSASQSMKLFRWNHPLQSSTVSPSAMWQLIWTADNMETEKLDSLSSLVSIRFAAGWPTIDGK